MKLLRLGFVPLLVLLAGAQVNGQSYSYIPFPDSNFTWKGSTWFGAQSQSWTDYWTYSNIGDTIINTSTYHKIASNTYVRTDSLNRVYFMNGWFNFSEKLLYDFTLSVGDTLLSDQTTFQIDSVDTINYLGVLRRTLYSHWKNGALTGTDIWIDGIGSNKGPLSVWHLYTGPSHGSVLCEASENSVIRFMRSDAMANDCVHYNTLQDTPLFSFCVYPNPAGHEIIITAETTNAVDVFIYDLVGNCLLVEKNVSSFPVSVRVNNLAMGYYIVRLTNLNGVASSKGLIIR